MAIMRRQNCVEARVCVCASVCLCERTGVCLVSACTDIIMCVPVQSHTYAYLMCVCARECMHVCVVHGQKPCQKPEARLASLKCKP